MNGVDRMEKIAELIADYNWMKKEIERLHNMIYGTTTPMRSWGVAQYGIDAAMPKGSKGMSSAEMDALDVRELNQIKRMKRYERNVFALESSFDVLADERQRIIYDCLLDEMTYRQIALKFSMSITNKRFLLDGREKSTIDKTFPFSSLPLERK